MDDKTSYRVQYWTVWSGPFCIITYLCLWIILGHNFPPPSPKLTGAELVATYYAPYRSQILFGMSGCAMTGLFYLPWSVLLAVQMWRREKAPVLSMLQLMGGTLTAWLLAFCPAMWAWCARYAATPGVDPELIKAIHLMTWYIYDMTYMITGFQLVGCGVFAILDKKLPAIFPAWTGWLALFVAASFLPLTFLPYFDTGWFALNGYWDFHVVFGVWGLWFTSYTYYMFKDVARVRITPAQGIAQSIAQGARA